MEEQNKYFTPDIEDLHIQYQCELSTKEDTVNETIKWEVSTVNSRNNLFVILRDMEINEEYSIRTKYLDKSDIESLGWIKTDLRGYFVRENEKTIYKLNYYTTNNFITIDAINKERHHFVNILYPGEFYELSDIRLFTGQCKSINELRIIHKLLQIN